MIRTGNWPGRKIHIPVYGPGLQEKSASANACFEEQTSRSTPHKHWGLSLNIYGFFMRVMLARFILMGGICVSDFTHQQRCGIYSMAVAGIRRTAR
jgi:hypothetical protein